MQASRAHVGGYYQAQRDVQIGVSSSTLIKGSVVELLAVRTDGQALVRRSQHGEFLSVDFSALELVAR